MPHKNCVPVRLPEQAIAHIVLYASNDIELLKKAFSSKPDFGKSGPSNAYGIYLTSLLDMWGAISNDRFGCVYHSDENVQAMLGILRSEYGGERYDFKPDEIPEVAKALRHNLVHDYGLRIISDQPKVTWKEDWPNVVADQSQTSIETLHKNPDTPNHEFCRWSLDVFRLAEDLFDFMRHAAWRSYWSSTPATNSRIVRSEHKG